MQDYQLLEKLAHQNCERIPERTVHAKGSGAYGSHPYSLRNAKGERFWVKFHFKTMPGHQFWTNEEAGHRAAPRPQPSASPLQPVISAGMNTGQAGARRAEPQRGLPMNRETPPLKTKNLRVSGPWPLPMNRHL